MARSAGSSLSGSYGQGASAAITRYGPCPGRRRLGADCLGLARDLQALEGSIDATGAVHVRGEFAEAFRLGPGCIAHLTRLGDRFAIPADCTGNVVESAAINSVGNFAQTVCGQVPFHRAPFVAPSSRALERLPRIGDVGVFGRGERLAEEVLRVFTAHDLLEIENRHGNPFAAELAPGVQAALAGDQFPGRCHDDRMQQPDIGDVLCQGVDVTQFAAMAVPTWISATGSVAPLMPVAPGEAAARETGRRLRRGPSRG